MATAKKATPVKVAATKIRIKLKSYDHMIIDKAAQTILETADRTGAIISGPIPLPVDIKKVTLNKSTFVHKDSREQYEIRTHKRLIDLDEATPQTVEALQNLHLPAGVEVAIRMMTMEG